MLAECNRIACCDVIRAISSKYEEHIHVYICMCASYIHTYIYIYMYSFTEPLSAQVRLNVELVMKRVKLQYTIKSNQ